MPASATNTVTKEGVDLGRHLFYDPILSGDSSFACGSCHKQSAAFSDGPNSFSAGITGAKQKRNTLPLFNLAWYPSLFWDGKAVSIEEQVFHPLRAHDEMNISWPVAIQRIKNSGLYRKKFKAAFGDATIDSVLVAKAIAQFERTLLSYRSKYDRVTNGLDYFTKEEAEGLTLMNDMTKGDCLHCHSTDADPLGTITGFSNNGLDTMPADKGRYGITQQAADMGAFKIPSVRNLSFTAPYMHDGRFNTLEEVLDFYSTGVKGSKHIDSRMGLAHRGGVHLSDKEKRSIIVFLRTMDDSVFVNDPAFSNPFLK
jgi:Cytochrome c peroxidase